MRPPGCPADRDAGSPTPDPSPRRRRSRARRLSRRPSHRGLPRRRRRAARVSSPGRDHRQRLPATPRGSASHHGVVTGQRVCQWRELEAAIGAPRMIGDGPVPRTPLVQAGAGDRDGVGGETARGGHESSDRSGGPNSSGRRLFRPQARLHETLQRFPLLDGLGVRGLRPAGVLVAQDIIHEFAERLGARQCLVDGLVLE